MQFFNSLVATIVVLASAISVAQTASTFNNILVIILENTDYSAAIADPNLAAFAASGVLFSNWDAIGHPSQPNYIALTSGSTNGVTNDNTVTINVQNVVDLLEAKGLTWKSYQENWPGNCFLGSVSQDGLYFRLVPNWFPADYLTGDI
jgi:Phosphoesterase family